MRFTDWVSYALIMVMAPLALADGYHHYSHSELVLIGCKASISAVTAFCNETANSYKCTCELPQGLGSLMNCVYTETVEFGTGVENMVIDYCADRAKTNLTVEQLRSTYENATHYLTDITALPGYNSSHYSYVPVYYDTKVYERTYQSTYIRYKNIDWAFWMGSGLLGYWVFIFLMAMVYNIINKTVFLSRHLHNHPINLIRKHLTLPALASSKRHTHPVMLFNTIGGFIPTRLESIVIFCYFVLIVVFASTGYTYVPNNTIWRSSRGAQMSRYPGDRTGILCLFSFLLSFLFAGRNNFLIWITGWKQSTFITYHKWVSRINFLLLVTHAGAMTVQSKTLGPGRYETRLTTPWMRWGIVALCCCSALIITASYRVRKTHYEVFVITHLLLVAFFLVGTWIHARDFGWDQFCYGMAAVWCFDRAVRYCRLIHFGVQTAQVTVVSEEILKVVVPRRSSWRAFPGAYGYLHYIRPTTFFQSHPFTIIETDEKHITFYTKIKGGITSSIHQHLSTMSGKTDQIKVSVEGPYGHQRSLHKYDTVIHFSGGTGVPTAYAYVLDSVTRGIDQHIKLYWVIRNWNSLDWFYDELLKLKGHGNVQVVIYVTKPDSEPGTRHLSFSSSSSSSSSSSESNVTNGHDEAIDEKSPMKASTKEKKTPMGMPPSSLDFIEFRYGRPDIDSLVQNDIMESNGTVAVLSSAHNSMVDDVRYAVSQNLDKANARVEYFEELQAW